MPSYTTTTIINNTPTVEELALPEAEANATSTSINIALAETSRRINTMAMQVGWPNIAAHTDSSKIITFTLQESADSANWSNTNPLIQVQLAGVANTGVTADNYRLPFPPYFDNYARIRIDVPASGPNVTNINANISLVVYTA